MSEQPRCPECNAFVGRDWLHCPNDGARLTPSRGEDALDVIRQRLKPSDKARSDAGISSAAKQCPRCFALYSDLSNYCSVDSTALVRLSPQNSDSLIGQVLGASYLILSIIGEGGNSRVYKARHVILERPVAVKVMHANHSTDDSNIRRFLQESRTVSSLNHPNIVSLFDFGLTEDGRPYFCMDYVEGVSLQDVIDQNGFLPGERAVPIFIQLCDALSHAHKKGIVHRDIKPSNILLTTTDHGEVPKLVDFGIAKMTNDAQSTSLRLTAEGTVCGSPVYMSPEQCLDEDVDHRTDIYSLGISLYETIAGQPPFDGESVISLFSKQLRQPAVPVRVLKPMANVPKALDEAVMKTLNKSRAERYQSMDELKSALEQVYGTKSRRRSAKDVAATVESTKLRILCVDDEEVSLLAYATALGKNSDFSVIGVAINGELAVQKAELLKPDLVIMDFELPVINGADATRMIKAQAPETKILLLSSHSDRAKVLEAFRAGVNGYALKSFPGERLFSMIREVVQGTLIIDDQLDEQVIYDAREIAYEAHIQRSKSQIFSHTEAEILKQLLQDASDDEICELLKMDAAAFELSKQAILRKLNKLYS